MKTCQLKFIPIKWGEKLKEAQDDLREGGAKLKNFRDEVLSKETNNESAEIEEFKSIVKDLASVISRLKQYETIHY